MTKDQVGLVKDSWERVVPISEEAAALFYGRLFQTAPEVRALFATDMAEQGRKLMAMLGMVVADLEEPERLLGPVRALGSRHAGYGAVAAHYDAVGAALLWTLARGLGDAFTPEVEAAWAEAYALVATTMLDAAQARAA